MNETSAPAQRLGARIVIRVRDATGGETGAPCDARQAYSVRAYLSNRRDSATLSVR